MFPKSSDMRLWKCSGADVMPNGNLLKQYLPNGVTIVVRRADSSASGTYQKPELASSFETNRAPDI
jgi:hypothetical protein